MDQFTRGGGVAVAVDKKYRSLELTEFSDPLCDSVCVLIPIEPKPLVLYLAYVSQAENSEKYRRHHILINRILQRYPSHDVIAVGDWNLHSIIWQYDETHTHFCPQIS